MRVSRLALLRQIDALAPAIMAAFVQAILTLRSEASVSIVSTMIQEGRIDEVLDALGIDSPRFAGVTEAVRTTYAAGGAQGGGELPKAGRTAFRFDMRNLQAEAWLRNHSSKMVTQIIADQREAIRIVVSAGVQLGQGPNTMALDLVGRIGENGRRTGGVVGLTSQQAEYVATARRQLRSGDPEQMSAYFRRQLRDRRFDGVVRRAMEAGKPVSAKDVARITGRYADRLLRLRGEMIARTEAHEAFMSGRNQALEQFIGDGKLQAQFVKKRWRSAGDDRTRDTHAAMDGQMVTYQQAFVSPGGAQMKFPGDSSLGAPASELIGCRCIDELVIDQIGQALYG
jgi:hypothetical protein